MKALNIFSIAILLFSFTACKKESSKAVNEPAWLKQDLLAYYPFNGNAKDSSGNGYDGVPTGNIQPSTDRNGKQNSALYFNNAELNVNINNTFLDEDFTISIWAQQEEMTAQYSRIMWGNNCLVLEFLRDNNPRQLNFYMFHPSANQFGHVNAVMDFLKWNHIVITNTNGINSLYLNGTYVNKSQTSRPQVGTGSANFIKIGRAAADFYNFKGKMDEIRFYKRALTDEEVKYLYQN